jgi:hypothetical protein
VRLIDLPLQSKNIPIIEITSSEKSSDVAFIHHNTIPRDDTPTSSRRLVLLSKRRN